MIYETANRLLLQFHITGRCNLRCKHCYRTEGDVETLTFNDIVNVIEQFKILRFQYNKANQIKKRAHINITGGEPFFRKDIKEILKYLGENKEYFFYGILSNGSFIDDETIKILKKTEVSFIQLSIDGNREMHDFLRAKGDYDRVLKTAKHLEKNGIRTYISFTANKENYKYLPLVANECRKRGITKLWSDRLVPIGNGKELEKLIITSDDFYSYRDTLLKAQGNIFTKILFKKTSVTMNRALQFLGSDGCYYSCSAGKSLITVDEFGNIMPCRRMPIICGNIFDSTLSQIYFGNENFDALRNSTLPKECKNCQYSSFCKGGAKCQSFAIFGDFKKADPGCPMLDSLAVKSEE
jgi:radical SAM protein with 4Fe4S-binding SPASM domain